MISVVGAGRELGLINTAAAQISRSALIAVATCAALGLDWTVRAQNFQNLDFEAGILSPVPGDSLGRIYFGPAFPGWTGYCGTSTQSVANFNQQYLSTAGISKLDTNYSVYSSTGLVRGRYCALLQSGLDWGPSAPIDAALAQRGTIPAGDSTIVLNTSVLTGPQLTITFNGADIPTAVLASYSNYMILGGDISRFAGQTGELRLTQPVLYSTGADGLAHLSWHPVVLDDIRFSSTALAAAPVVLLSPVATQWARIGSTIRIEAYATAYPPPTYQWWFNGTNLIANATKTTLTLSNVQPSQIGAYSVVVSNIYGVVSSGASVLVRDPSITVQPQDLALVAGQTAQFSAEAISSTGVDFVWMKDGVAVTNGVKGPGSVNLTLTISNVLAKDEGDYSVRVSYLGSDVSRAAKLTVRDPVLNFQTSGQSAEVGGNASFAVNAAGSLPLAYQWFFCGNPIPEATNPSLQLSRVQPSQGGSYYVVVTNSYGAVTSSPAMLNVLPAPASAVLEASNSLVCLGPADSLRLTLGHYVGGIRELEFGVFDTLQLKTDDVGRQFTVGQADDPDFAPLVALLTNGRPDTIVYRAVAGAVSFLTGGPEAVWLVPLPAGGNGVDFKGFSIPNFTLQLDELKFVPFSSWTETSYRFRVFVNYVPGPPPSLLGSPLSQTAETGSDVVFSVGAEGAPPLACQWLFNGAHAITSADAGRALRLTNVQPAQAGTYSAIVRNGFGSTNSAPATLSVIPRVERRAVPAISLTGQPGSLMDLEISTAPAGARDWNRLATVVLTDPSQWYFDLESPLVQARFYRTSQTAGAGPPASLGLHLVPAVTLAGSVGGVVQLDFINQFGPTEAWRPLAAVTLTNASQLYFDTSAIGQPPRLYRLNP